MFNLDTAIETWRHSLSYRRTILKSDLDELERHVRDEVEAHVANGMSEELAFRTAMSHMGHHPSIDSEYQKIYWGKLRKQHALKHEIAWRMSMLKNYFKIALRLLVKQKTYAFINIFGLAVGIACCLLLLLYVRDELTFDTQHVNADRIARVVMEENENNGSVKGAFPWMPYPLGKTLEAEIPGVENAIRLLQRNVIARAGSTTIEEEVLFADPEILTAFTYPMAMGSPDVLSPTREGVVISERTAKKYFGDEPALGKILEFRFNQVYEPMEVVGIVKDIPANNTIRFDLLLPFEMLPQKYDWIQTDRWNASSFYVYVLLAPSFDREAARPLLSDFRHKYHPDDQLAEAREKGDWTNPNDPLTYAFQPLREIHLNPNVQGGLTEPSNPMYSWILAGIAFIILLLACINFTTLSIGRSASRTREIALRKVVGAQRSQLIGQFGGEAILMSVLALVLGVILAAFLLPTFNVLADKELILRSNGQWMIPLGLLGLAILVALLSGFYPSLVLSRFQPTDMLRKQSKMGGSHRLTSALVLFQFTLSIGLIAGTSIMVRQMDYLQTVDIGYDKDHVVLVPTSGLSGQKLLSHYRSELQNNPTIEGMTGMTNAFSHGWSRNGWDYLGEQKEAYVYRIESDFMDVMNMDMVAGRSFDANRSLDSTEAVIVNEALVRSMGWDNPIGEILHGFNDDPTPAVVGVVKDFNFLSLHNEVEPAVFIMYPDYQIGDLLFQVSPQNAQQAIEDLRQIWANYAPEIPFEYAFLDDDLNNQYANEARWSKIIMAASFFAILIACLGLFGLASLSVSGRTKEIGIRRVLGASTTSIASMLSEGFVRIVIVAVVLAVPLTWVIATKWLENFAFHIEIGVWVFVLSALFAISIALITVSFQTIRAAGANPVESLRLE